MRFLVHIVGLRKLAWNRYKRSSLFNFKHMLRYYLKYFLTMQYKMLLYARTTFQECFNCDFIYIQGVPLENQFS